MAPPTTTALDRQLRDGAPKPRPTPLDALRVARRAFLEGRRVDVTAVAAELGVSRVTVHRWVGSRERLLAEVLWGLTQETLALEARRTRARGGRRVAAIVGGFIDDLLVHPGMQRFLEEEGEFAMRLVTRGDGGFQPRLVGAFADLLRDAQATSDFRPGMDVDELALALVRVAETYVHRRLITGEVAEPGSAMPLLRLILR
ncbi:QsdR family transcriptional regulator [Conexibacter sp. SYSU D00693]|uniref:QsdR family transcriptional regulator n=1 Tax=Conexibacter sp. SYSU D00693 TaxID=2812560 RepID=UPI00196B0D8E|nr:QsdR family transcriptional regulator [Conexibacter sp. SYSU D00693]